MPVSVAVGPLSLAVIVPDPQPSASKSQFARPLESVAVTAELPPRLSLRVTLSLSAATLPKASSAVSVTTSEPPAASVLGPLPTTNWLAAAALTVTMLLVPLIDSVVESLTFTVCVPTVSSVMLSVATPLVKLDGVPNTACPSVLLKVTGPV